MSLAVYLRNALVAGFAAGAFLLIGNSPAWAQGNRVELLAHIDLDTFESPSGNDCWGYVSGTGREYALMGLRDQVAFVEITDPRNPDWFASIAHTSNNWGDVKVYGDHAYAVTETQTGIQVIDLSDIDNHNVTLVRTINSPSRSHNLAVDETSGYLYTCGSNGGSATTVIFDLSDPANPVEVGTWTGAYQHDMQVITFESGPNAGRQIMFGASEGRGVDIVDVTDKSNTFLISRTPYPNVSYCHQVWTEDGQYLYIDDELDSIPRTSVMDVSDLANPVVVGEFTSGLGATDHNLYVRDGFLYAANYRSGLRIFDLNIDPVNPPQVGYYDTYPGTDGPGFGGAWSNYPFFPSGTVIISDKNFGLFIVDPSEALGPRVRFDYPEGRAAYVSPSGGTRMVVRAVGDEDVEPQPGTGVLYVDTGSGFQQYAMNDLGSNVYEAVFPTSTCGTIVQYYISVEDTSGDVHADPVLAPEQVHHATSAIGVAVALMDDFETDTGWTVDNEDLADGPWERGVPAGNGRRGDPLTDYDGTGSAYVTGIQAGRDVDGGPTTLVSPVLDLASLEDPMVNYARWVAWLDNDENFNGGGGGQDFMIVEFSDDAGSTWTVVENVTGSGGWISQSIRLLDHVEATEQVRVRFSIADNPNDSVTEAGLDAFRVDSLICAGIAELVDLTMIDGFVRGGSVDDLRASDNQVLDIEARVTGEVAQPHLIRMLLGAETSAESPATIDLTIESRVTDIEASVWLFLRDWDSGQQVQVDSFTVGMNESVHTASVSNAPRFVRNSDGRVELEIKEIVFFPFTLGGFHALFDQIEIGVR